MKLRRSILSAVVLALGVQAAVPALARPEERRDLSKVFQALSDEQTAEELQNLSLSEKRALLQGLELILEDDAIRLTYAQETLKTVDEVEYKIGKATALAVGASAVSFLGAYLLEGKSYRGSNTLFGAGVLSLIVLGVLGRQLRDQGHVVRVNKTQVDELLKKIQTQQALVKAIKLQLENKF